MAPTGEKGPAYMHGQEGRRSHHTRRRCTLCAARVLEPGGGRGLRHTTGLSPLASASVFLLQPATLTPLFALPCRTLSWHPSA